MRILFLIPVLLILNGCCDWYLTVGDDEVETDHPTEVRVNNRTDQSVIIRYISAGGVDYRTSVPVGGHLDFEMWPSSNAIKADYNHLIHWYDVDDECEVSIDIEAEDFVPAMPAANG